MVKFMINGDENAVSVIALDGLFQTWDLKVGVSNYLPSWDTYEFRITAKEGYNLVRVEYINDLYETTERTNIVDNKVTFSVPLDDSMGFYITIDTEGNIPARDVIGFNRLYLVDKKTLTDFAGERFTVGGVDLGSYILNVLELPFTLNTDVLGGETTIRLGSNAVTTKAIELINDEIIVDLGNIEVPAKYNNSYDFLNTETILHLPFTTSITLDVNYVIGFTINVKYIIDLYTGDVTINVVSSKTNNIIHSESTKIGRDIPFIKKIGGETVNTLSTKNGLNNGILSPFIEVVRNVPYETNSIFNSDVVTETTLNSVTGLVNVNNVILNTTATLNEKNRITNLLRNGVYIK